MGFLSGILMNHILDKVLLITGIKPIVLLKYADNIRAIMRIDEMKTFIDCLNSIHTIICFTTEIESRGKINFLDTSIKEWNGKIATLW